MSTTTDSTPATGPGADGEAVPADPTTGGHVLAPGTEQVLPGGSLIPTLAGRFYTDPAIFARE